MIRHDPRDPPAYFRGRYRIESARLRGFDYTSAGMYHIVICTAHRVRWFGEVSGESVSLSPAGRIVRDQLLVTPAVRPAVGLDAWIVMPDHVHAILSLRAKVAPAGVAGPRLPPGSVGAIVNQIKGACTKRIRAAGFPGFRMAGAVLRPHHPLPQTARRDTEVHPPQPRALALRLVPNIVHSPPPPAPRGRPAARLPRSRHREPSARQPTDGPLANRWAVRFANRMGGW